MVEFLAVLQQLLLRSKRWRELHFKSFAIRTAGTSDNPKFCLLDLFILEKKQIVD